MTDIETTAAESWKCLSCLELVPYGFEHICSAKIANDQGITVFPGQLSMVDINKKLDIISEDVKEIKEKLKDKV